jgi:hypothetical protein
MNSGFSNMSSGDWVLFAMIMMVLPGAALYAYGVNRRDQARAKVYRPPYRWKVWHDPSNEVYPYKFVVQKRTYMGEMDYSYRDIATAQVEKTKEEAERSARNIVIGLENADTAAWETLEQNA